jgi:hypothetical protein
MRSAAECCLPWEEAFWRLAARLAALAATDEVRRLVEPAAETFWGAGATGAPPRRRSAGSEACFTEWFLLDYVAPCRAGTLLGEFADSAAALDAREELLLLALLLAPMRACEVREAPRPDGVAVKDLLAGSEGAVGPFGLPDGLIRSDICVGRTLSIGRFRRVGFSLLTFSSEGRGDLLAYLRAAYGLSRPGRHVSLEDYVDGAAYLYHHFFLERGPAVEGRPHRTCRWTPLQAGRVGYRGLDPNRIRAALDRQSVLEAVGATEEGKRFLWIDRVRGVTLGTIVVREDELHARAETAEDLSQLSVFLEACLRGLVRRLPPDTDLVPTPTPQKDAATAGGVSGTTFVRRMLAAWADTPSPALSGQTPRAACLSEVGRDAVTGLLVDLERNMARQRRIGRAWGDVGPLWDALHLSPPLPAQGGGGGEAPSLKTHERTRTARR